jgi:integrase
MPIEKLSASKVARIKKSGKYGDGNGLYLFVTKNLVKSWVFRYQRNGNEHYMGLGPLYAVNIKEAREEARRARVCLAQNIDPLQERMKVLVENKEITDTEFNKTFEECAIEYIVQHKHGWKSVRHQKQWKRSLEKYAFPIIGKMFVLDITTTHVLEVLEPIWTNITITAARLRERMEHVLSWATIRRFREGDNPARWNGHLQVLLAKPSRIKTVQHYSSMPYHEIDEFFRLLNAHESIGARALEFTILTVCRTSEALSARWSEIDFEQRIWIIPSNRMKNKRQHRIPLTDAALRILHTQKGLHSYWIFPNPKKDGPYCESLMSDQLKRMHRHDITVHGFRSTFRVWAAESGYPRELAEMALSHKQASAVEEAYQRSDLFERRRVMMEDWTHWCVKSTQYLQIPDLEKFSTKFQTAGESVFL